MFIKSSRLQKFADKANKLFFDGRLKHVVVGWDDELENTSFGLTIHVEEKEATKILFHQIHLNKEMEKLPSQIWQGTLIHELAHVSVYPCVNHGRKFQEEMKRLANRDAFKFIW